MKRSQRIITTALIALATATSGVIIESFGDKCGGVNRWDVKVLTDDVSKIKSRAVKTTIADLCALETFHAGTHTPRQEVEMTKYTLENIKIVKKISEADEDLHLVLEDDDGTQMIAEIPYYDCDSAQKSGFAAVYLRARINFLKHARDFKDYRWNITGVAFVDISHGGSQHGVAPNEIELHPVLRLEAIEE